jgi:hypothetical protein
MKQPSLPRKLADQDPAKPGTIQDFLRVRAETRKNSITTKPPFTSFEAFVLAYGRSFESKPYPKSLDKYRGEDEHACFKNAWWLVLESDGKYRYVEGYAAPENSFVRFGDTVYPNAIFHGWGIDRHDRVIDPTWPDTGGVYFGVVFDSDYLMRTSVRDREHTCLIGNQWDDFPLLTGEHTQADWMPREK